MTFRSSKGLIFRHDTTFQLQQYLPTVSAFASRFQVGNTEGEGKMSVGSKGGLKREGVRLYKESSFNDEFYDRFSDC